MPAIRCEACGRYHLDPIALGLVRAEVRKRVGQKAIQFGMRSLPWGDCALCSNQRVVPSSDGTAQCTACKEVYLPLATVRGAATEAPEEIEARLLEEIARAPDDDASRHVLADLLLERGDPRGEFIRLQLDEAQQGPQLERAARINELLEQHQWSWVPRGADAARCEFRRGLLFRADWPESTVPTHEGWATVEQLELPSRLSEPGTREWSPLGGPTRHALRRISRCGPFTRAWLLDDPPPNLTSLGLLLERPWWGPELPRRLEAVVRRFPRLVELDVDWDTGVDSSAEAVVVQLLEVLGPRLSTLWLPGVVQVEAVQPTLRRVAPKLSLRLSSPTRYGSDRAWVQVEADRAWLEQRGPPSEWVVGPVRGLL